MRGEAAAQQQQRGEERLLHRRVRATNAAQTATEAANHTTGYPSGWGHHHTHNNKTNEINMLANFEVSVMVID